VDDFLVDADAGVAREAVAHFAAAVVLDGGGGAGPFNFFAGDFIELARGGAGGGGGFHLGDDGDEDVAGAAHHFDFASGFEFDGHRDNFKISI
jgi:hypothetical protein